MTNVERVEEENRKRLEEAAKLDFLTETVLPEFPEGSKIGIHVWAAECFVEVPAVDGLSAAIEFAEVHGCHQTIFKVTDGATTSFLPQTRAENYLYIRESRKMVAVGAYIYKLDRISRDYPTEKILICYAECGDTDILAEIRIPVKNDADTELLWNTNPTNPNQRYRFKNESGYFNSVTRYWSPPGSAHYILHE